MTRPPPRAALALTLATIALAACDVRSALPPDPATAQRTTDATTAAALRAHLEALPIVAGAGVVIERGVADPLAPTITPITPAVAIAIVATGAIEPARLDDVARTAARALVGDDARVSVAILPAADRPALARLGPFTVAAGARGPLLALIAGGLAVIAALAVALTLVLARRRDPR